MPGERGSLYLSVAEAAAHVAACSLLGVQAGFHVIGDAGRDAALDALDRAAAEVGRAAGQAPPATASNTSNSPTRTQSVGWPGPVTVSAQPGFDAARGGDTGLYRERLGDRERDESFCVLLRRRGPHPLWQRQSGDSVPPVGQRPRLP